jgi:thioredoxin reductase (NADPH)
MTTPPPSPSLPQSQLRTLASRGKERTAAVGDVLFRVGDARYPFIAILEGEAAILNSAGDEIIRHGKSGFLGGMNLMSGQTVYLTAVVTQPMRYIAVDRDDLRALLFEDGPLSDLLLSAFMARRGALQLEGVGIEVFGPRSSEPTRRIVEFARRNRLPHTWLDPEHSDDPNVTTLIDGLQPGEVPLVRLPGGLELRNPSNGEVSRALGIGLELAPREEVDLVVIGAGPAGLGAAVYGASEGLETLVVESTALGGQAGTSRRIENYLGFPAGISGSELTSRAVTQARKFNARTATPYRALALEPGKDRHVVRLEDDHEIAARAVVLATGAEYAGCAAATTSARRCRTTSCSSSSATGWRCATAAKWPSYTAPTVSLRRLRCATASGSPSPSCFSSSAQHPAPPGLATSSNVTTRASC